MSKRDNKRKIHPRPKTTPKRSGDDFRKEGGQPRKPKPPVSKPETRKSGDTRERS